MDGLLAQVFDPVKKREYHFDAFLRKRMAEKTAHSDTPLYGAAPSAWARARAHQLLNPRNPRQRWAGREARPVE